MEQASASPRITLDADGRIDQDLLCIECGYNLRGLPPAGQCPECGRSIEESMKQDLLRYADVWWLRRVAIGTRMAFHGAVWMTVLPFVLFLLGMVLESLFSPMALLLEIDEFLPLLLIVPICLAGTILVGLWLIGGPDPASLQMPQPRPLASRIARPVVVAAGVLLFAAFAMYLGADDWLPLLAIMACLVVWAACIALLGGLARRIPALPLAQQFAILGRLVIWLTVAAGILFGLFIAVEGLPVSAMDLEIILPICRLGVLLAWFALNIWYLVALGKLGKQIRAVWKDAIPIVEGQSVGGDLLSPASQSRTEEIRRGLLWIVASLAGSLVLGMVNRSGLMGRSLDIQDFYTADYAINVLRGMLLGLQSLMALTAICGALRATAAPWPATDRLRRICRGVLTSCGLLTVLAATNWRMGLSEGRVLIAPAIAVLAILGWSMFAGYLVSLAQGLKNERLVRRMRLASGAVLVTGVLWFCMDLGWLHTREPASLAGSWESSPEHQRQGALYGLVHQALWLAWQASLILSAAILYWNLRQRRATASGSQAKSHQLPSPQAAGE